MIGKTIAHYQVVEKLGQGGMGVVYKGRDARLDRFVALKILPPHKGADPEGRRRFVQEARAASALNHPNIITIYDISESDGVHFIAMEYVAGKTLGQLIGPEGLRLNDVLKYAIQIADAVAAAHSAGITHRDLKPGNIMITDSGLAKVLDFGLAKLTERAVTGEFADTETAGFLNERFTTTEGMIVGTMPYMSPEQAQGKPIDSRSDVFSFGSVLYEMVTGRRPFTGDNHAAVLSAILRDEPERISANLPSVPIELERLISRALRKDPERRWQSMADVRVALADIQEESSSGVSATRISGSSSGSRSQRRVGAALTAAKWPMAAALTAAILVAGVMTWWSTKPGAGSGLPPPTVVPFTSFPGLEQDPAFSPDGKQVAFAWDGGAGNRFSIYAKLLRTGGPLRLTGEGADDCCPAWSPDGSQIAFLRIVKGENEVDLVPSLGGPVRKLSTSMATVTWRPNDPQRPNGNPGSFGLAWSPDGRFLAMLDRSGRKEPGGIFLLRIDSGEKRRLTLPPPEAVGDLFPAFSPDGRTLAFARSVATRVSDIYLLPIAADGSPKGDPKPLTSDGRNVWGLDWTPDGRSILFSSNRGGNAGLWRVAATGGTPERLTIGGDNGFSPSVSRQGNRLVYTRFIKDTDIWRITPPAAAAGATGVGANRAGPASRDAVATRFISSTQEDTSPQFSPDGKRIAFVSSRAGSREVWVCDSEGSNARQVTSFNGPQVGEPRWSPDGRRLVLNARTSGNLNLYVINAEGGSARRLTTGTADDGRPSWSKDGQWIYFASNRTGSWELWKTPADPEALRQPAVQLTHNGGREPIASPDGKFVYYAKESKPGIWRVSVDGGEEMQILDRGRFGGWAVTDGGVYLLGQGQSQDAVIEFFNFATRRMENVCPLPRDVTLYTPTPHLAVSPDGRWFLYVHQAQTESDIMLVENFR